MLFKIILIYFLFLTNFLSCSQFTANNILNINNSNSTHSKIKNLNLTILIKQIPNIKQNLYQSAIIFAHHVSQADELISNLILDNNYAKHQI